MPERSDRLNETNAAAGEHELPYISKSRLMQWMENPEHFRLKYLEGLKPEETFPMRRGSRIHETFEHIYDQQLLRGRFVGVGYEGLLPERKSLWQDFVEPYISNFLKWEARRWEEANEEAVNYLPYSVEDEHWRDPILGIEGEPEWMGMADVILPSESFAHFEDGGVIVVDFKTGSVPDEQYRPEGIYSELEYYSLLFEDKYDVVGAAAYYPRSDTLVPQPSGTDYRTKILEEARELVEAVNEYEGDGTFEINPGPLCKWGTDDDEESAYYGVCDKCTWGVPAQNENTLEVLVEEGYTDTEIADHLGCEPGEVSYWKYKLDL